MICVSFVLLDDRWMKNVSANKRRFSNQLSSWLYAVLVGFLKARSKFNPVSLTILPP